MTENMQDYHFVLIEWDGEKPPTKWYRKLDSLVGGVRSGEAANKENMSAIVRRAEHGQAGSVVFQEGCILCKSETLARELALYARDEIGYDMQREGRRPPTVMIGNARATRAFTPTPEDDMYLKKITDVLGKRGKRPDPVKYVVTCHEDLGVHTTEKPKGHAINCPNCGGFKINVREGGEMVYYDDGSPIFELWLRTRFNYHAHFEPCEILPEHAKNDVGVQSAPPLAGVELYNAKDDDTVNAMKQSTEIARAMADMEQGEFTTRMQAIDLLDAIFVARRHYTAQQVLDSRVKAFQQYIKVGGNVQNITIAQMPTPDLLDASKHLNIQTVVGHLIAYVHNANGVQNGQ